MSWRNVQITLLRHQTKLKSRHVSANYVCQPSQDLSSKQLRPLPWSTELCMRLRPNKQTDKQTNKLANEQTNRQTDRQTGKNTNRETNRKKLKSRWISNRWGQSEDARGEPWRESSGSRHALTNYLGFWWAQENLPARALRSQQEPCAQQALDAREIYYGVNLIIEARSGRPWL